jgi:segregation and condensation protein B
VELKRIIEGLLFASGEPLTISKIHSLIDGADRWAIKEAIEELRREYESSGRAFRVTEVGGGYQLRTIPELAPWIRRLSKHAPPRLSRASLETLAVIAYRQPVTRAEVEHIRGVDCGAVMRGLVEKGLVKILGRKDVPGRPLLYGTSKRFLEVFGLKDLSSLPQLSEVEELVSSHDRETEDPGQGEGEKGHSHDAPL